MPQLDMAAYPTQMFWLVVCFVVLLLLMWRVGLPRIRSVLEARQARISDDLSQAERLRNDAADALKAYETAQAEARSKAQSLLGETRVRLAEEAATRRATLDQELGQRLGEAETRIQAARDQALESVRDVASEIARAATARLIGAEPSQAASDAAIDAAMESRS